MKKRLNFLLLLFFLLLSSCKQEEKYVYPPVRLEFVTICSDVSGAITSLQTDNGLHWQVENDHTQTYIESDSSRRAVCNYVLVREATSQAKGSVEIYSLLKNITLASVSEEQLETDPVEIQSVWMSGGYINLVLLVKSQVSSLHTLGYQATVMPIGAEFALSICLHHNNGNDLEAYTQKAYLSIPIQSYLQVDPNLKSITVNINTYSGMRCFTFHI